MAYPTEAVYGLGCDPLNLEAVARLLAIKQRPAHKGLILIGASRAQLQPYTTVDLVHDERLQQSWPGPVTWVLPAREQVPYLLKGSHPGIALRLTDHPVAAALCNAFGGALVSTSANRAARPALRRATAVQARLGTQLDMLLHGDTDPEASPSEIRDYASGRILRPA